MPNLDFYAVGTDHRAVLDLVFGMGDFRVFEEYSEPDEQLREFTSADQVPPVEVQRFLTLHVVGSGPEPAPRRINLRPGSLGNATFWHKCEGIGLIQLHLGGFDLDTGELRLSHTNHSTEKRALKWSPITAAEPGGWDWALITRVSNRLNRRIRGLAVRKIGPHPVLPGAAQLIADARLRYVYGLGIHPLPSVGMRGEAARLAHAAARPPGTVFPGGADAAEVADLERALGHSLPTDLADWLGVCKGDVIGPGGLFGVRHDSGPPDIASVLSEFPAYRERGWLPIAGDGNGGHYVYVIDGELAGCIGFVDRANVDALGYVAATNVWTFLWFLLQRHSGEDRRWPLDRNHVTGHDPAMATIPAWLQPWR